ncbi:RNA methyltransferase [Fibrobacter sp. UWR2]|uniref:RNA methyltransferase n=1 Tax=Fibrobacter sp. UWR2 TaxID=1964352 RepID=UPI000B5208B0|nr:RNA methyltransferase [Fibrobacter sp. UWR2]OWU99679.1 RNA methyltransferase [Fibrobacter sp. UWR2]
MEFFDYFSNLFGERWPALLEALKGEGCATELRFGDGLEPYYLDEASVFAAKTLGVEPGDRVLDMCAAPGGKSLVLASGLKGEGSLQSNDRSPDRRLRLSHVLENSLPEQWRSVVSVTGYDGVKFGMHKKESYDRILLDAPCSSDRHVLNAPEHLKVWSVKRVKRLAVEQGSLLASAVDALAPGGTLVYSTCALSPMENDDVVKKILKKRPAMRLDEIAQIPAGADRTECGVHILPDRAAGRGPIYCARLVKG